MQPSLGVKVLGLCMLVASAIAFGAVGAAQAETGACWGYKSGTESKCFSTSLEPKVSIELEGSAGTFLLANTNLEVKCTNAAFIEGGELSSNGSVLLGRLEFTGCLSYSRIPSLKELAFCTPEDPVSGLGTIRTEKGKGLMVLHSGKPVVTLEPDTGANLAIIHLGTLCAAAEEILVEGKLVLQDTGGQTSFEEEKETHALQEFTSLQLMHVGGNKATIDTTAKVSLSGSHIGLKWSGKFPPIVESECWGYKEGANLKCFNSTLEAKPVLEIENKTATLLIANKNVEVLCTAAAFIEGGTLSTKGSILLGRVEFSGCISRTSDAKLELLKTCEPVDPVAGKGKIRTEKGTGSIVLHEAEPVVKLTPDTGTILTKINLGEECPVGEELIVEGNLVLQDAGEKIGFEKHALTHLVREFAKLQLMKVGVNKATIDGTVNVTLASPHNALEWAGSAP